MYFTLYLRSHISSVCQLYCIVLDNCELKVDDYSDEGDIQYGSEYDEEDEESFFLKCNEPSL